jgi:hypothetical protein
MKHVVITIRYSILTQKRASAWKIGRDNFDKYKENLLSEERLARRLDIFRKITLPSLLALNHNKPNDVALAVHLLTSEEFPDTSHVALASLIAEHDFITILYYSSQNASLSAAFQSYGSSLPNGTLIANVRLDDDDALASDFLQILHPFIYDNFDGFVISPSKGYAARLGRDNTIHQIKEYKWRMGAAGQTIIQKKLAKNKLISIYSCGNHVRVDEKFPTVLQSRNNLFIRTFHSDNDAKVSFDALKGVILSEDRVSQAIAAFGIL